MGLLRDIDEMSAWIAGALSGSGYRADFSLSSLKEVDRFFDEQTENGQAKPHGLLAEKLGRRIFAIGAYVGEVVRRSVGGTWTADDSDPYGEINVELKLPDGNAIWPVQRVMKRFQNGSEDGIAAYGQVACRNVQQPTRKRP